MGRMKEILIDLQENISAMSASEILYINREFEDMIIPIAVFHKVNYRVIDVLPNNVLAAIADAGKLKFDEGDLFYAN